MNSSSSQMGMSSGGTGSDVRQSTRLVTDVGTRTLHAIMALSFGLAYLTAESEWWRLWHLAMGYVFAGAAVMRILFGVLGPRQVQLVVWWRRSQAVGRWTQKALQPAQWTLEHARMAALMAIYASVICLLLAVLPVTLSGLVVQGDWGPGFWVDWMAEGHEAVGEFMLALVLVHVGAVLVHGWLKRTPHWQRMFSGRLPERGPDVTGGWPQAWAGVSVALTLGFLVLVFSGQWAL